MAAERRVRRDSVGGQESSSAAPLYNRRRDVLLYQLTADNQLRFSVDPKHPSRRKSAFQTDLCVFERASSQVQPPRVVLGVQDADHNSRRDHVQRQVAKAQAGVPWLRYGIVASGRPLPHTASSFTMKGSTSFRAGWDRPRRRSASPRRLARRGGRDIASA